MILVTTKLRGNLLVNVSFTCHGSGSLLSVKTINRT